MNDPSSQEKLDLDRLEALESGVGRRGGMTEPLSSLVARLRGLSMAHGKAGRGGSGYHDEEDWEPVVTASEALPALLRAARERDLCQENREKLRAKIEKRITDPDCGSAARHELYAVLALIEEKE